jgi:Protein of unknown function (DUF2800)
MTNQAHNILATAIEALKGIDLTKIDSAQLVPLIKQVQDICSFNAAIHAQIETRAIGNGELIPGVVVKDAIVHRKWHDIEAASDLARTELGDKAFSKPALLSPAQIEKLGDKGKSFVSLASFKPEAGKKVDY